MQNSQNKKKLQIVLLVLVAVLTLGIGYASITAVNLIINGNGTATANQENFKVYFTASSITEGKGTVSIDEKDPTIGYFDITGLSKAGDYAEATYTVLNNSNGVGAEISLDVTSSNNEYFKVTETVADTQLQAGEDTTATIKVEMIKTPIENAVTTSVTAKLIASPIENSKALGGRTKNETSPDLYIYTVNQESKKIYIGEEIPSGINIYNNFNLAKDIISHPVAIAHIKENNYISSSYISFEMNGERYYLQGGIGEPKNNRPVYDSNVSITKEAIGSNWSNYCEGGASGYFSCSVNNLEIAMYDCGDVYVSDSNYSWNCRIYKNGQPVGYSYCNY